jgi:ectoine hydroxylase-related dioxygenase (phytanoyl-CoA dioxygenase family)
MSSPAKIHERGYEIFPAVIARSEAASLAKALSQEQLPRTRAGIRHVLQSSAVAGIASDSRLMGLGRSILGGHAYPYRATLFDKSPRSNWLVVWHQDTALPLRERKDVSGWGPWSVKQGVHYAHAPATALSKVVDLRLHLDDSNEGNGPLRVLPATHTCGVLSDQMIEQIASRLSPVQCISDCGGVVAMRPLVIHSSSKSRVEAPRRVLHIEYASSLAIESGLELAIA